jgi:hypothetical protein
MLVLDADIYLDTPSENSNALTWDINPKLILRPCINFGNGYLFTGQIIARDELEVIKRGQYYRVHIEMRTIYEEEVFKFVEDLVYVGAIFTIQTGHKIVGKGKIIDFLFFPEQ